MNRNSETYPWPGAGRSRVIAITGATGLIGSALVRKLRSAGHEVRGISRGTSAAIQWDPKQGKLDPSDLEGVDGVVHLAGESIAQRWTPGARSRILESRRQGTLLLARTAAGLQRPPRSFVSISGINAYGATRSEPLVEESEAGDGFLAKVCREWETATAPVDAAGIRKVILRSGMVISRDGGALRLMLPIFRTGLAGPIGRGQRWMSWIAIDDLVNALAESLFDERFSGIYNVTAPGAVRNQGFTRTLADCLHRPAVIPVPPIALKLVLGQMAEETLLSDLRVEPARLQKLGFRFKFPELRGALEHSLQAASAEGG